MPKKSLHFKFRFHGQRVMPAAPSVFVEFFGPSLWRAMHAISFTYPPNAPHDIRKKYIDFYISLGTVIPCPSCAKHYSDYMKKNPITADGPGDLSKWVYDLHSDVNARNKKPNPSYEEVKEFYTGYDRKKHEALNKLPEEDQLKALANPRMKKLSLTPSDAKPKDNHDQNTIIVVLMLVGALVLLVLATRRMGFFTNKKKA